MSCVFCDICSQSHLSKVVYRDNVVSCFLPRKMEVYGHLLVVPNQHWQNIFDIPDEDLAHVMKIAKKMSLRLQTGLGATGVNILHASGKSAQQSVLHFHIHLIPRYDNDGLDAWPKLQEAQYDREEIFRKLTI